VIDVPKLGRRITVEFTPAPRNCGRPQAVEEKHAYSARVPICSTAVSPNQHPVTKAFTPIEVINLRPLFEKAIVNAIVIYGRDKLSSAIFSVMYKNILSVSPHEMSIVMKAFSVIPQPVGFVRRFRKFGWCLDPVAPRKQG
jgi:hypothetical protein